MKIAVIGIGSVGLPFAAVASKFHEVVGIDTNIEWIKKLTRAPFGLPEDQAE